MTDKKKKLLHIFKLLVGNALRFAFSLGFITGYQMLFGAQDVLTGVAVSVGLTMFPTMDLGIKPLPAAGTMVLLFLCSTTAAQFRLFSPWLALPVNFLVVVLIILLSGEPVQLRPSISFLLCFVFSQAMPVPWAAFPKRLFGVCTGALLVAAATLFFWKKRGYGTGGRTMKEQIILCSKNRSYLLRMSAGIAAAMFAGTILNLKKPLWISIVVMSLTQIDFQETCTRIRHRALGTLVGAAAFLLFFRLLIPQQYSFLMILLLGYISYFMPEYKHKQTVNAICAINASMVLLDTGEAIITRILCLIGGIAITLILWLAQKLAKEIQPRLKNGRQTAL